MKSALTALALLLFLTTAAQTREEIFDYSFKPARTGGYYFVETERTDSGWRRQAFYLSQRTMAMEGLYKDDSCTIPHGLFSRYHTTRYLQSRGRYVNGKQQGIWLSYNEKGQLTDSSVYNNGHRSGIAFSFHDNGELRDSFNCDGNGNNTQVSWYDDGSLASAGRWTQDTIKAGRWKYYHRNGQVMATEDYTGGRLTLCQCYSESGLALDTALCREQEAEPAGGLRGWQLFLQRGLQAMLERKANSREWGTGTLTVVIRFLVEKDGSLSSFAPLTAYGKGVEEEIINILRKAPRWTPGRQWGKAVRSYHTQPVTFAIQDPN